MNLLDNLNFRLNSLEDVYEEANFDDCLQRLFDYEAEFKTNYQIPKKYNPDPELGAWVTIIHRIGKDDIESVRRKKLDDIGFAWVSTRKCGSAFMKSFRSLKERLESCSELNEGEPITCKGGDIAAFNGFAPHRSDSKQCCLRK